LPFIFYNFQCNQISMWPLALLSLALVAAMHRRWSTFGLWLALAIFVKVFPALLIGYCLLRRRFKAALIAIVIPAALSPAIDVAISGPEAAWRHHVHWYHVCFTRSAGAAFLERGAQLRHENQGLPAILGRLLRPGPPDLSAPLAPDSDRPV